MRNEPQHWCVAGAVGKLTMSSAQTVTDPDVARAVVDSDPEQVPHTEIVKFATWAVTSGGAGHRRRRLRPSCTPGRSRASAAGRRWPSTAA
ncbi:hypothetical protein HBB16_14050 [Pseudonocardia sp. MCCB 268]|nr:hypothetical protein [Pseudonocardia cytotoxica]